MKDNTITQDEFEGIMTEYNRLHTQLLKDTIRENIKR